MKIRSPLLIRLAGLAGAGLLWPWMKSLRLEMIWREQASDPFRSDASDRYIYAFWHESILGALRAGFQRLDLFTVMIGRHQDGEIITQIVRPYGISVARGSTSRGGRAALRRMMADSARRNLLITPDGPRGPRRKVQAGVVWLSSATGMPIVPLGVGFSRARRAGSWDRFAVPWPLSRVVAVSGAPIVVPPDLEKEQIDAWTRRVEDAMLETTSTAESMCHQAGKPPGP
ncbi:MAG: hypothetical protein CMJ18_02185 [Phycisphaeraceae bacterium]|nr:hypothetical protein [Phycisphaeraceae bacterium]